MNTFDKVYKAVVMVPRGKVTTYGTIAKYIGIQNPRVVGYALHANKHPDIVPCHRVVNSKGELAKGYAFGGLGIQKQLLSQEGIKFIGDKIELDKFLFNFQPSSRI
jgi:methylated-DNA-protein-cysteine methyltransferase related protein